MTTMTRRLAATAAVSLAVLAGCGSDDSANEDDAAPDAPSTSPDVPGASDDRIQPAEYQDIRWEPLPRYADGKQTTSHVRFRHDGTWTGSDGCNGQSGRYTLSPRGDLTAKPAPQTLMACPGVSINAALDASDRVGVEGDRLTLYDGDKVLLVLTASPADA